MTGRSWISRLLGADFMGPLAALLVDTLRYRDTQRAMQNP